MVDPGLTVIQDSIGSATLENTGEIIKFSNANNNNITTTNITTTHTMRMAAVWLSVVYCCLLLPTMGVTYVPSSV